MTKSHQSEDFVHDRLPAQLSLAWTTLLLVITAHSQPQWPGNNWSSCVQNAPLISDYPFNGVSDHQDLSCNNQKLSNQNSHSGCRLAPSLIQVMSNAHWRLTQESKEVCEYLSYHLLIWGHVLTYKLMYSLLLTRSHCISNRKWAKSGTVLF